MKKSNENELTAMEINWKQQKAISDPFRSRLIGMLYENPMTPKQAADALNKNPGTTYYHIQQLVKHDILEVDHVDTDKGVVEKYYKSKAIAFKNPELKTGSDLKESREANLYLSDELFSQMTDEVHQLLLKYGKRSFDERNEKEQKAYLVKWLVQESPEEEKK